VTVTIAVGIPLGIVSAIRRAQWIDYAILLLSLVGVSAPVFLLGFLLIFFLSYSLPVFPTAGATTPLHLVLPAITLGLPSAAVVVRLTRTSMLEVLNEDYVRTATAKGLRRRVVLVRHALRNALIPVITIVGLQFGFLLNGSIIVEQVFAWPGIGSLIVNAASLGDFPVLQGATLLFTLTFVVVNLTVDLVCGMVDPRVRTATDER
jgi:ABC-type dipeptide/oligopeptide/nickel transport system permease component